MQSASPAFRGQVHVLKVKPGRAHSHDHKLVARVDLSWCLWAGTQQSCRFVNGTQGRAHRHELKVNGSRVRWSQHLRKIQSRYVSSSLDAPLSIQRLNPPPPLHLCEPVNDNIAELTSDLGQFWCTSRTKTAF